jgi:hypothetical protein
MLLCLMSGWSVGLTHETPLHGIAGLISGVGMFYLPLFIGDWLTCVRIQRSKCTDGEKESPMGTLMMADMAFLWL